MPESRLKAMNARLLLKEDHRRFKELLARVKAQLRVGRQLNQARLEARTRSAMMDMMTEVTESLKPDEIY